ncbi:hypothetical protein HDU84_005721 [Entophlyctis sp. JEL0112]|nr:hypothetical protein HDU84_005721 [Entophlyctis sp. JEL0112]
MSQQQQQQHQQQHQQQPASAAAGNASNININSNGGSSNTPAHPIDFSSLLVNSYTDSAPTDLSWLDTPAPAAPPRMSSLAPSTPAPAAAHSSTPVPVAAASPSPAPVHSPAPQQSAAHLQHQPPIHLIQQNPLLAQNPALARFQVQTHQNPAAIVARNYMMLQAQLQQQRLQNPPAPAQGLVDTPELQQKLDTLLATVPKDKLPIAAGLANRLKAGQITVPQFTEAMKTALRGEPPQAQQSPAATQSQQGLLGQTAQNTAQQQQVAVAQNPPRQAQQSTSGQHKQTPQAMQQSNSSKSAKGKKGDGKEEETKIDVDAMMDITSYAGVDIREEEDLLTSIPTRSRQAAVVVKRETVHSFDRSRIQNLVNLETLKGIVDKIAVKVMKSNPALSSPVKFTQQSLEYMAISLEQRMQALIENSVRASKHRTGIQQHAFISANSLPTPPRQQSSGTTPSNNEEGDSPTSQQPAQVAKINPNKMYADVKLAGDVKAVMAHLEKAERAAEVKEKASLHPDGRGKSAAETMNSAENGGGSGAGGADGTDEGAVPGKKRRKKDASAKLGESDSVKTKLTNNAALLATGKKGIKSWMIGGGIGVGVASAKANVDGESGSAPRKKRRLKGEAEEVFDYSDLAGVGVFMDDGNKIQLGRQMTAKEMCRVTLKDCVFALENEPQMTTSFILHKWMGRIS